MVDLAKASLVKLLDSSNKNKQLNDTLDYMKGQPASSYDVTLALHINLCIPVAISRVKIPNSIS